jgi:CheY-like chemotaxis protein
MSSARSSWFKARKPVAAVRGALLCLKSGICTHEIQIPVTVLSADVAPGRQERPIAGGANGYLTKPLDVPELLVLAARAPPKLLV